MANKACRIKHGPLAKGHATVEGCCRSTVVANRPALLWGACTRRTTLPAWLPTMNQIPLAPGSAKQHWMQLSNVEHKVERKKKQPFPQRPELGPCWNVLWQWAVSPPRAVVRWPEEPSLACLAHSDDPEYAPLHCSQHRYDYWHPQGKAKQMSTLPHNRTAMGKKKVSS